MGIKKGAIAKLKISWKKIRRKKNGGGLIPKKIYNKSYLELFDVNDEWMGEKMGGHNRNCVHVWVNVNVNER